MGLQPEKTLRKGKEFLGTGEITACGAAEENNPGGGSRGAAGTEPGPAWQGAGPRA